MAESAAGENTRHELTVPRNDIEKRLLVIWKSVLGTHSEDVGQDFFELGGHSLLAAKLLARIEKEFGRSLSLAFVFQSPTIEQMAESLLSAGQTLRERVIVAIQPKGSLPPLFWVRGGPRFVCWRRSWGLINRSSDSTCLHRWQQVAGSLQV